MWTALAVALTAAMAWVTEGLHPWWPLAWLAPVPVLLLALRRGTLHAALAAGIAWAIGRACLWPYFALLHVPAPLAAVFVLAPAVLFALFVLLFRALVLRGAPWAGALALPAAWVTVELLLSHGPDGTWGSRAYTQMDCTPVLQLASLAGAWGVSFVVTLGGSALAVALHRRDRWMLRATLAVVAAVFAFGIWRMNAPLPPGGTGVRIGQAALAETRENVQQAVTGDPAGAGAILDAYGRLVQEVAHQGPTVVVLPEEIAGARPGDLAHVRERLAAMARSGRVTLVAGLRLVDEPQGRNVAMVFSPSGELLGTYVKEHLVRGFETPRLAPGQDLLLVDAQARAGVEICKDMDFPALTRRYADAGAAVLLVPAWDFGDDGWMHARMAVLRGVEQGLPVARSAQSGLLTASDAFGRVQDEARTGDDAVSQVVVLRAGRIPTLYGRWGDWFAYASAGLLLLVLLRLVWLVVRGRHFTSRAAALRTIRAASS